MQLQGHLRPLMAKPGVLAKGLAKNLLNFIEPGEKSQEKNFLGICMISIRTLIATWVFT
jgi:hypothetical protein